MAQLSQQALDIQTITQPVDLANRIGELWLQWKSARNEWEEEKRELRNYIFATDTTKTTNKSLPWKNSTTQPKLTQIRDNLHANYMAAMFPHRDWFTWEAETEEATDRAKASAIKAYMKNKLERSNFREVVSRLVYDFIDYGNVFGEVSYVTQNHFPESEMPLSVYHGPMLHRVSPMDIVFDLTAANFKNTPKITRSLISLGTLQKEAESGTSFPWAAEALEYAKNLRAGLGEYKQVDINKHSGISVDGFGDFNTYLTSGLVEVLEFEGDIYDVDNKQLLIGHRIIIVDRKEVVHKAPFDSWLGTSSKEHVGWRLRPDNLLAMGPLDNLVGMQYRIDHLENLKADVFDQIAHPVIYKRGYVEDFEWGPGAEINGDTESQVTVLSPDTTALNADFQIQNLMNVMEEMAGAPRQAMGIRTPGEKTAFEVQTLDNASSRIFQDKISWFETQFLEPVLNQMLEVARRNLNVADTVKIIDEDFGVEEFITITQDDLKIRGKLKPIGARHFARQNQLTQNLMGLVNSGLYQDPMVNAHISSVRLAEVLEELLDLDRFNLVSPNIRVAEQMELQQQQTAAQEMQVSQLQQNQATDEEALANVPIDEE